MGIDKADVRLVAHIELPESLEAYYRRPAGPDETVRTRTPLYYIMTELLARSKKRRPNLTYRPKKFAKCINL